MKENTFTHPIDKLVYQAVFGSDEEKQESRYDIWVQATDQGVIPASVHDLYMAKITGQIPSGLSTPAMNLRGMTYDIARAAFSSAIEHNVGAMVFEIARSEIGYTDQRPQEYVSVIMAAALREGWTGPLFIQGDHFQAKAESMGVAKEGEIDLIKDLIRESIDAGFYNIDIDMSTLVDLDKPTEDEQQEPNIKYSLEIAKFIRSLEPMGVTVSLGGEIGHIGGKNSTEEDFHAYMSGFNDGLGEGVKGMSKISVQTGTHHGGVVLSDGSLADLDVDFSILSNITKVGIEKYNMGGAVQHGASTLPDKFFNQFSKSAAVEVHLATGFQNIQMDHPSFPKPLLDKIYAWLDENKQGERSEGQTDEQFHYKLRKKAWGEFKQDTWNIPEEAKVAIRASLSERFSFFFKELNVINTANIVAEIVKPIVVQKTISDFSLKKVQEDNVEGLDD